MNRLINRLPVTVTIDNAEYPIDTDFRVCLMILSAFKDVELTDHEKIGIMLLNLYGGLPHDYEAAVNKAIEFLCCGDVTEYKQTSKLYDFEQDDKYIYAALLQKNIDLNKIEHMHWWTFMSHFTEIGECAFSRIVYLRSQHSKGKLSKDERKECDKIGWDIIRIKDPAFEAQREEIEKYIFGKD